MATRIEARVTRLELAAAGTIPAARVRLLLGAVVGIIRRNVTDRDTLRRIADDLGGGGRDIGNAAVPAEVLTWVIGEAVAALRRHVTDAEALARIGNELGRLAGVDRDLLRDV